MSAVTMPEPTPLRRSHNHLDSQRREPGECPACDDDWREQAARLSDLRTRPSGHGEVDNLIRHTTTRANLDVCVAISIDGHNHVCDLPARHRGKHHCPQCRDSWSAIP
jgi:ribosomal protein L37AE/L43A